MRELTPLEKVPGFDEPIRKKLAEYWITSAEEFHGVYRSSNQQYTTGRKALAATLGLGEERIKALAEAVRSVLPADTPFSTSVEIEVGAGLVMEGVPEVDGTSFDLPVDLPSVVEPLSKTKGLRAPVNQGKRNTCVAFSLAALYQVLSSDPTDLSEQFFYFVCKERDGIRGDVGTNPALAMQLMRDVGICSEQTWPYKPEPVDNANPGHARPSDVAFTEAKLRRFSGFTQLPATGSQAVSQIKKALSSGKAVMIGMPIYEHWTSCTQATLLGRLRFPLNGERKSGGHAMCVVGYRDDEGAPGGGYFIVRNSWGTDWGTENSDGPGYCHMPYLLVARYNLVTFVAEGVVPVENKPASFSPQASVESEQPIGSATTSAFVELLSEARLIQERLNALVAKLTSLVGSAAPATAPVGAAVVQTELTTTVTTASATVSVGTGYSGPMVFISTEAAAGSEELYPNGIDGVTGQPLLRIDAAAASLLAQGLGPEPDEMKNLYKNKKIAAEGGTFGTIADVDQKKIVEARWAVVVNALEDSAMLKAIWPLIRHRMRQMGYPDTKLDAFDFRAGENCGAWSMRHTDNGKKTLAENSTDVPPVLIYRPGERVNQWLAREPHKTSQVSVDPKRGVPFYLMLVGRPGPLNADDKIFIPLTFQYELDFYWGVGRIVFTDADGRHRLDDYTTYANKVVDFETKQDAADRLRKTIAFFGTKHEEDNSTIRSANELVTPLFEWSQTGKISVREGYGRQVFLEGEATRSNLEKLLSGGFENKPPALLFTASHGLGLPAGDSRMVLQQGSLVTQDWTGFGNIKREHWFAGEDLGASTKVDGMIAFLFACYGAGCPSQDEFVFEKGRPRPIIAPFPFVAQLPQRLLLNGALAVLGHVERAWTYSFSGTEAGLTRQIQPFQTVLGHLMDGHPCGSATDEFNVTQGNRSLSLTAELEAIEFGANVDPVLLSRYWMARNDARNYALLGDPAVKLPFAVKGDE